MTKSKTDIPILDDEAIARLEAIMASGDSQAMYEAASVDNVRALCATVRQLRADAKLVDEYIAEVKRELGMRPNAHLSITLERYKERVATSMRSACVEKVKAALADEQRKWPDGVATSDYELGQRAAFTYALSVLESVSIQEQEK